MSGPVSTLSGGPGDLEKGYGLLRHDVAIVPWRRDVVSVSGPDALEYMQGQCSQDVAALAVGGSTDALLLEPQGRIDALVRVTRTGDQVLLVDTDKGFGDVVVARLGRFKLRVKVDIELLDWTCVAVRGPGADAVTTGPEELRVDSRWPGVDGFDLLAELPKSPTGVDECGPAAWEAVRIEAGIPMMGSEIDEKVIPEEAGLVERCVSFTKGCYTGQELVARLDSRGSNVARRLRGLVLEDPDRSQSIAVGSEVFANGKQSGRVTSVAWSPGLGSVVALGYVHRSVAESSLVTIGDLSAEVRSLPLVG
jgi:tRNA-modifying protein YgfZ